MGIRLEGQGLFLHWALVLQPFVASEIQQPPRKELPQTVHNSLARISEELFKRLIIQLSIES